MILLEFAAQGIRGVAPAGGRTALRPGYNVVVADGATLRRLLESLLYPAPRDADGLPRASAAAGAPLRAGLTFVGVDRVTYRVLRDFAAGTQLHRFDPGTRAFAPVSQRLDEIAAFLQGTAGVPPPARLAALLALSAAELPSRQPGAGVGGSAPALPGRTALTGEQVQRKVAALRAERERARVAEKLQYDLDVLQSRAFKAAEIIKAGGRLREGHERALAERAALEPVAQVAAQLGDPEARLASFDKATARHAEAVAKIEAEREALAAADGRGAPPPLWRDPRFLAGAGAGVAAALVGAVGALVEPSLRYVALVDIPAFGFAAWVSLRWVSALEGWERLARRRRVVDEWEKKVEAQYARDAAEVRAAAHALGADGPVEIRADLRRLAEADAAVADWRRRIAEWEASPTTRAARAEKAEVGQAQEALEGQLEALQGGFFRDVRSIDQELQRLEAEAAQPVAAAAQPGAAALGPDPLRGLLERAAAVLGGSAAAAGRAVAPRASQFLSGLALQRLGGIQVDDRGGLQAIAGGRPVPVLTLPPAERDLVFLAIRLALLEEALAGGRQVGLVDESFAGVSEGGRRFAGKLLKQLARPGQIVHATSDAAFREAADHSA